MNLSCLAFSPSGPISVQVRVTGCAVKGAGPHRGYARPGTGSLHPVAIRLTVKIVCGISFPPCSAPNVEPSTVLDFPAAPTVTWIWCKNFLNRIQARGRQNVNGLQHLPRSNLCTGRV